MEAADYAASRGLTKGRVSQLKAEGLLATVPHPDGGRRYLVDAEKSDLLRTARGHSAAATSPVVNFDQARRAASIELDLKQADLDFRLARNEKQLGTLVSLTKVEAELTDAARRIQDRVRSAARNQSDRLAVETDPRVIAELLDRAIIEAFTSAANDLEDELDAEAAQIEAETLAAMTAEEADPDPPAQP